MRGGQDAQGKTLQPQKASRPERRSRTAAAATRQAEDTIMPSGNSDEPLAFRPRKQKHHRLVPQQTRLIFTGFDGHYNGEPAIIIKGKKKSDTTQFRKDGREALLLMLCTGLGWAGLNNLRRRQRPRAGMKPRYFF